MTIRTGFSATKTVNGETQPDFAAEKTANSSVLGKMINGMVEYLTRFNVKGTGGVVGTYDSQVLGEAAFKLLHGYANTVTVYGVSINAAYFNLTHNVNAQQ